MLIATGSQKPSPSCAGGGDAVSATSSRPISSTESRSTSDVEVKPTGECVPDHGVPRPILLYQAIDGRVDMAVLDFTADKDSSTAKTAKGKKEKSSK